MKAKKIFAVLCACAIAMFSFTACGGNDNNETTEPSATQSSDEMTTDAATTEGLGEDTTDAGATGETAENTNEITDNIAQ